MPPISKAVVPLTTPSMEEEEHHRHAEGEGAAEHQLPPHSAKANNDTSSASREENVPKSIFKRSVDERDSSSKHEAVVTSMEEDRDEKSKRKSSAIHASFAFVDDRDERSKTERLHSTYMRPSVAFTKSTDTRDNDLVSDPRSDVSSPVGTGGGGNPFTRRGPEALVVPLEEQERIVFVPQEELKPAASDHDSHLRERPEAVEHERVLPTSARGMEDDPLARSDPLTYQAPLSPLMETEHIVVDLETPDTVLPSRSADEDSLTEDSAFANQNPASEAPLVPLTESEHAASEPQEQPQQEATVTSTANQSPASEESIVPLTESELAASGPQEQPEQEATVPSTVDESAPDTWYDVPLVENETAAKVSSKQKEETNDVQDSETTTTGEANSSVSDGEERNDGSKDVLDSVTDKPVESSPDAAVSAQPMENAPEEQPDVVLESPLTVAEETDDQLIAAIAAVTSPETLAQTESSTISPTSKASSFASSDKDDKTDEAEHNEGRDIESGLAFDPEDDSTESAVEPNTGDVPIENHAQSLLEEQSSQLSHVSNEEDPTSQIDEEAVSDTEEKVTLPIASSEPSNLNVQEESQDVSSTSVTAKDPDAYIVRTVSEGFIDRGSATMLEDTIALERVVSAPPVIKRNVTPDPPGRKTTEGSFETFENDDESPLRLKSEEKEFPDPATEKEAKLEQQDMDLKIATAMRSSLSDIQVGAFSEIDPRALEEMKGKTVAKMEVADIPVQQDALSPNSTDIETAFQVGHEHEPNTFASPGAYREGGNRGGIDIGFSRSESGSSTIFSAEDEEETTNDPVPLTAQLVDEDKLRLQAERDAEEALRRLMDQAVQGQAVVLGNEEDGELSDDFDGSHKKKKEQPRRVYSSFIVFALIMITALIITVVTLTRPDEEPPVPFVKKTWIQLGPDLDGQQADESWGSSVALSSNATMLAGAAFFHDVNGSSNVGRVRVFSHDEEDEDQWVQLGQDLYGDEANDEFGFEVSFSPDGSLLAIGAGRSNETDRRAGYVRVFQLNNDTGTEKWEQLGQDLKGGSEDDLFGYYLSVSNNGIAVGAPDTDATGYHYGAVHVFRFDDVDTQQWYRVGQVILGEEDGDEAGVAVDLSEDGNILAVGAWLNDGNGADSGHVRVFQLNEELNVWDRLGTDIDSEEEDDSFGFSVSLSSDGTIVAAGAPWNDMSPSLSNTGHVRVYKFDLATNDWVQMGNDINGQVKRDNFGYRVGLSADGMTLAGSSFLSDGVNAQSAGHVRVFDFDETLGDWVQRGSAIDGEATGDEFGQAMSLSANGQVVAAGAVYATNDEGVKTGHIRVFQPVKDDER